MQFTLLAIAAAAGTFAAPLTKRDITGATLNADRLLESDHSLIELGKRGDELITAAVSADRLVESDHDGVTVLPRDIAGATLNADRLLESDHSLVEVAKRGDELVTADVSADRLVESDHDVDALFSRDITGATLNADRLLESDHSLIDVLSKRDISGASLSADRLLESDQSLVNIDRLLEDQDSLVDANHLFNVNLAKRQLSVSEDVVPAAKDALNVSKDVSSLAALTTATIPTLSVPTFAVLATSVSLPLTSAVPTSIDFQNLALKLSTISSLPTFTLLGSVLPSLPTANAALPTGVSNTLLENNSNSNVNKLLAGSEDQTTTIDKTLNGKQTITSTKNVTGSFEPLELTSGDQALSVGKGSVTDVQTDSVTESGFLTQQVKQEDKQTAPSLDTTANTNGLIADIPNLKRDSTLHHLKADLKSLTSTATAIPTFLTSIISNSDVAAVTTFVNKVVATASAELSSDVAPAQTFVTPLASAVSPAETAVVKQVEGISTAVSRLTTLSAVAPLATAATL